jgi:anaerobic ribonucleoside-triphosphate reductase activating protein
MLNLAGEIKNSNANGPGMRYVIFTQGCSHEPKCEGCHNFHTWRDTPNRLISIDEIFRRITNEMPIIKGVTFSGGEPFDQADELLNLAIKIKKAGLNLMCYTGYTYEEIRSYAIMRSMKFTNMNKLLDMVDILVDGKFDITKTNNPGLYRGSSNQRILYLDKGEIIKIE